jgi:hypothetical protein
MVISRVTVIVNAEREEKLTENGVKLYCAV